jgi:two-component system sensor histidine kinase KdpD
VNAALLDLSTELAGRSVHVDMAETLPPVAMDGERIREVLRHLLQNAAKFSPPRSPIRVSAEVAGDFLEIQVVDQGRGIDVAEQQQVFASFYRGRDSGNVPGTGMGLAIARTLIEAHGGSIGVRNQPGQGAAFTVRLPAGGNR